MANHPVPAPSGAERAAQPLLCGAARVLELSDQFLASGHVVALTEGDEQLFTTVEMLGVQDRIGARFIKGLHQGAHLVRSEEHTSELQSLMRISYAVFCLKKKIKDQIYNKY